MPRRSDRDICAIFVHAGAGYHSHENEIHHLNACSDAAKTGMAILKGGGNAVDAVEMAIKILEDRVITNSGYGSNLSMDGTVECDATVVDHCGRSGAVGAVSQIKNPISLARLLLETSLHEMTLRRIPPNLLAGEGAIDFAEEHGMPVLPHDFLVSDGARKRYIKWKIELDKAEAEENGMNPRLGMTPDPESSFEEYTRQRIRADYIQSVRAAVHSQKFHDLAKAQRSRSVRQDKDSLSESGTSHSPSGTPQPGRDETQSIDEFIDPLGPPGVFLGFCKGGLSDSIHRDSTEAAGYVPSLQVPHMMDESSDDVMGSTAVPPATELAAFVQNDGQSESESGASSDKSMQLPSLTPSPPSTGSAQHHSSGMLADTPSEMRSRVYNVSPSPPLDSRSRSDQTRDDSITDTVGVIAVDSYGRIAAGSSSGGIGMKHRGRIGPAALVGVGTSVIPLDPEDKEKTSVATVTSGTGEHIATTMAASMCADRLYSNLRKTRRGHLESATEENILESFITRDFMNHPGVKYSSSEAAIGIMAVKKCKDGIYTYFAHNTDSFALASMHSNEEVPSCTMSRISSDGSIALGARAVKHKRKCLRAANGKTTA